MKKFTDQYKEFLNEASQISTIFEYDELLLENPDDFYNISGSSSFILYEDFYAVDKNTDAGGYTHGDILLNLEAHFINDDEIEEDIEIGGNIPKELREFFLKTYSGDIACDRDDFLHELNFGILGRINIEEKIISFWNSANDFTQSVINNVLKLVQEVYKEKPDDYRYELAHPTDYYDAELLEYDEFIGLNQYVKPNDSQKSKRSSKHILHNIDPAIKAEIMKDQGIKPKKPLGAAARYAMGESSSFDDFIESLA